ncbi:MAG: hypothetical protein WAK31_02545 [Chthoniobacterales bacterium]
MTELLILHLTADEEALFTSRRGHRDAGIVSNGLRDPFNFRLLVIQSGAIAPDGAMVDALNHLGYRVQGFSGLPPGDNDRGESPGVLYLTKPSGCGSMCVPR